MGIIRHGFTDPITTAVSCDQYGKAFTDIVTLETVFFAPADGAGLAKFAANLPRIATKILTHAPIGVPDLGDAEEFLHATTAEHAQNIMANKLNADSAIVAGSFRGGRFYTLRVNMFNSVDHAVELALKFGDIAHGPGCVVVSCRLPKVTVGQLESEGLLVSEPPLGDWYFMPESFPLVNIVGEFKIRGR